MKQKFAGLTLSGLLVLSACAEPELILPGTRFDVRADLADSIAIVGEPAPVDTTGRIANQSVPISLPSPVANADWPTRGGNTRHLPPHGVLSAQPQRVFSVDIGAGNSRKNRIAAAPIVAAGKVFTLDATAGLVATAINGAAVWATDLTPPNDRTNPVSGGGLAYGAGKVFAATGFGELIALNPGTGAVIWRQKLGSAVTGAPTVDGDTVFVVGRDSSGWAVNTETGRVLWTLAGTPAAAGMIGGAAPAIADRTVLFPMASGEIIAVLKIAGVRVWGSDVAGERRGRAYGGVADITGDPVVAGDVVYAGNASGRTIAIETSTGLPVWQAGEGALGPILPVAGSLFLVNDEARLVRLDASTGQVIWSVAMPYYVDAKIKRRAEITAHYGPVLAGGRIVVASGDGLLRLFSPVDGSLVATAEIPGGAASQPVLAGGLLYVVGARGQLHAFR